MATHSSVLAWRIPGTGEPHGLPSLGSHRVGHDRSKLAAAAEGFRVPACLSLALSTNTRQCVRHITTLSLQFLLWGQRRITRADLPHRADHHIIGKYSNISKSLCEQ